jgi:hypothetical protein
MKTFFDIILMVAWVVGYLSVVNAVGQYRKARVHVSGPTGRNEYRADRDVALKLVVLFIGVLSVVVIYAFSRMVG